MQRFVHSGFVHVRLNTSMNSIQKPSDLKVSKIRKLVLFCSIPLIFVSLFAYQMPKVWQRPLPYYSSNYSSNSKDYGKGIDSNLCFLKIPELPSNITNEKKITNIYLLKVHKTGSTSLYNIFARFAWNNNLRVATYTGQQHPGRNTLMHYMVPPFITSKSAKFHMSLEHTTYRKRDLDQVLERPFIHISILRNPVSWAESYLRYFKMLKPLGLSKSNTILSLLDKFENESGFRENNKEILKQLEKHIPSMFAMNLDRFQNNNILQAVDNIFFIGITEYFDEFLILLRRMLNWSLKDVIYSPLRVAHYKRHTKTKQVYTRFCKIIPRTCRLYEYFNSSFWRKFNREGGDIREEVYHFKNILKKKTEFCLSFFRKMKSKSYHLSSLTDNVQAELSFTSSKWHGAFNYTFRDCALSMLHTHTYRSLFYYTQNRNVTCTKKCPVFSAQDLCNGICQVKNDENMFEKVLSMKNAYLFGVYS